MLPLMAKHTERRMTKKEIGRWLLSLDECEIRGWTYSYEYLRKCSKLFEIVLKELSSPGGR
jgi:hypothetical protein